MLSSCPYFLIPVLAMPIYILSTEAASENEYGQMPIFFIQPDSQLYYRARIRNPLLKAFSGAI